jgi:hypothetical protein
MHRKSMGLWQPKAVHGQDFRLMVLAKAAKVLTNHIPTASSPHPSVGEVRSPPVGGDVDSDPKPNGTETTAIKWISSTITQ